MIRILPAALEEVREAVAYYNRERPGLGEDFREVDSTRDRIERSPQLWPPVSKRARMCRTKRFPYLVIYVRLETEIVVVAVMHGSRRPGYWKDRLKDLGS